MPDRKYFKHSIVELESIFVNAKGDFAILEELEEELENRSTQRAKKLQSEVQNTLSKPVNSETNSHKASSSEELTVTSDMHAPATANSTNTRSNDNEVIDWDMLISHSSSQKLDVEDGNIEEKPLDNSPLDILDTWTALESLSPQSYKNPKDLVIGKGSVAYLNSGQEPWLKGERSIPKCNLYYLVYLGAVDLQKATAQLLTV